MSVSARERLIVALDLPTLKAAEEMVTRLGDTVLFGSEVKALLAHPRMQARMDERALLEYFTFQNLFTRRTLFAGVELMQDKARRTPWPAERKVGTTVQDIALKHGLIVRAIGDRIAFTPPLIITKEQVGEMCRRFGVALDEAQKTLNL